MVFKFNNIMFNFDKIFSIKVQYIEGLIYSYLEFSIQEYPKQENPLNKKITKTLPEKVLGKNEDIYKVKNIHPKVEELIYYSKEEQKEMVETFEYHVLNNLNNAKTTEGIIASELDFDNIYNDVIDEKHNEKWYALKHLPEYGKDLDSLEKQEENMLPTGKI